MKIPKNRANTEILKNSAHSKKILPTLKNRADSAILKNRSNKAKSAKRNPLTQIRNDVSRTDRPNLYFFDFSGFCRPILTFADPENFSNGSTRIFEDPLHNARENMQLLFTLIEISIKIS